MTDRLVFCDIDHVISDSSWRDHLIKPVMTRKDWFKYHLRCDEDCVNPLLFEYLQPTDFIFLSIVFVTSRPVVFEKKTRNWLRKHDIWCRDILMRPEGNVQPPADLKVKLIRKYLETHHPEILPIKCTLIDNDIDIVKKVSGELGIPSILWPVNK